MKSNILSLILTILLSALMLSSQLAAETARYRAIELPTLGGLANYPSANRPENQIMSNSGIVAIEADIPAPDPFAPNCYIPDCLLSHAALWNQGVLTDLGALPGDGNSSASGAINALGWVAGQSENGQIDPASGLPETRATLWTPRGLIDFGTFGGNWSLSVNLNNLGQVVGFASNSIPDPFSMGFFPPSATQVRAFLWQNGVLQDLGTLGGPDAAAFSVNQHGQVAGFSYTNAIPNDTTGIPTMHAFLWDHGKMTDLGTLGGTLSGAITDGVTEIVNDKGQVIGASTLAGDQTLHAFLWDRGTLADLGTLGGDNAVPTWLTDNGDVVGAADLLGSQVHHAFLWRNGVMTDLGTLGTNSTALMSNSRGQVVGRSLTATGLHAFVWEHGGPMLDLNGLIPAGFDLLLEEAENINNRGEILVWAEPPGCPDDHLCGRLVLLVPCGANDACHNQYADPASEDMIAPVTRALTDMAAWRARVAQRYHIPALRVPRD
jgi:probable HAF family extracellular repeat protein